jgi:MFS family permease
MQEVVIGYELYRITGDPLALGLTGLAEAIPFISLSLFGGHLADRLHRKTIILVATGCITASSIFLFFVASNIQHYSSHTLIVVIYSVIFFIGICRAFQFPAAWAFRATLIPPSAYENASTWSSSSWQTGAIVGPAMSGFLYAWLGFSNTLLVVVALLVCAFLFYARVAGRPVERPAEDEPLLKSLKKGIRFVYDTKIIFYAISLDLFSVFFGGVMAILPIFAEDILHVGPQGLGILRAAPSVGAVMTLLILARMSVMERAWRTLLLSVAAFSVCILVFAVSPWMWLSIGALFFSGAFDSVSVVIRHTLLQIKTPDVMRGRVLAINGIFLSSSNEVGAFESGFAARLMGTVPSVVFGSIMALVTVGWIYWKSKELFDTPV